MKDRAKIFKLLIDEYGLEQATNMSGLSKLEFIGESGIPIDLTIVNNILPELFNKKKYKNCKIDFDSYTGTVDWYCDWDGEKTFTYATPFWEGQSSIPVNTGSYESKMSDGSFVLLDETDLENNGFTEIKWKYGFKNLNLFEEWIKKFYLPKVYEVIQQHLEEYRNV